MCTMYNRCDQQGYKYITIIVNRELFKIYTIGTYYIIKVDIYRYKIYNTDVLYRTKYCCLHTHTHIYDYIIWYINMYIIK